MTKITSFFRPKKDGPDKMSNSLSKRERGDRASASQEHDDDADVSQNRKRSKSSDAVERLLSFLNEAEDEQQKAGNTWKHALQKHFASKSFSGLAHFVAKERAAHTVYPLEKDTWSALQMCQLSQTKVVIVGQDPYHGPQQAHGLCFSVLPAQPVPPSLKNIYKELANDTDVANFTSIPQHGHLIRWAEQGVLLLNTVMTVRRGQANSHKNQGWEKVTDEIIRAVVAHNNNIVFLLWGNPAAKKALHMIGNSSRKHEVICTSHPSPLGATKTSSPFIGSRCFSRCNKALVKMGHDPIDWNVDGPL